MTVYGPIITFNVAQFRAAYPEFGATPPTDATLQGYWNTATCFVSDCNYGWLRGDCRAQVLNLLAAHIATLAALIAVGETPGIVTGATIDKVSVTLEPPPATSQQQWWFNLTPYGAQAWALLSVRSVGGFYVGGSATRAGFRGNSGYAIIR